MDVVTRKQGMRAMLGLMIATAAAVGAPQVYAPQTVSAGPAACGSHRSVWHAAYVPARPPARCAHAIGTIALPHGASAFRT